ncbi:MAG TPA: DUF2637 domain-containing protein [Candidatus Acidoferrum sp.]|nr:DUF2637 domain-containing protein [Candidatus Acidoferrum sp.]
MRQRETESERGGESRRRRAAFLIPIVLVNVLALGGQAAWTYGEMVTGFLEGMVAASIAAGVLLGVTLESISVYLMLEAHAATLEQQSSGTLRLAAYAISAIMATLNYNHWSRWSWGLGVGFALLSMVSPFLWSVRSKRASAAQRAARGEVDPAGVKLSTARKFWHPLLSLRVVRWAAWAGETDPTRAVSTWQREESAPLRGHVEIETPPERVALEIETARVESETETLTETVTETRTVERKRSVSSEARMRERLERVRERYPRWETENVTYGQIGELLSISGSQTRKDIRDALYAGTSQRERVVNG